MTGRRSKLQMSIEVLDTISCGEHRPTRLMYACNLSWRSINDVLSLLESKGYIEDLSEEGMRKHLSITNNGKELLGYFSGLENLVQVSNI